MLELNDLRKTEDALVSFASLSNSCTVFSGEFLISCGFFYVEEAKSADPRERTGTGTAARRGK